MSDNKETKQAPAVDAGARDERAVDPDDIDAVSEAIQRECVCEWEVAQNCAVAAIDTLIARGNHSAALSRASEVGQVSKGWKLVPAEPTVEMMNAALPHDVTFGHGFKRRIYQEMLAASPTAPSGAQDERGAFEHIERASNLERDDEGDYVNPCVQSAWEGFQKGCVHAHAASTPANVAQGAEDVTENRVKEGASEAAAGEPVPAGWKIVPIEPTVEMKIAGDNAGFWCGDKWRAMIDAAPTPVADGGAMDDLRAIQSVLRELDPKWRERGEFGVVAREQIIAAIRYLAAPQPASEQQDEMSIGGVKVVLDPSMPPNEIKAVFPGEQQAASAVSDAAILACAFVINGICLTRPQDTWLKAIEGRIRYMLAAKGDGQ